MRTLVGRVATLATAATLLAACGGGQDPFKVTRSACPAVAVLQNTGDVTLFSRPGGGTRIGERLSSRPVRLYSDPAYAGLQAAPFVTAEPKPFETVTAKELPPR